MKRTLHYLLLPVISLIFASSAFAQELVYEQDHGVSFNKGTIDSDALIAIIQKKQEELNKFVLGRIVTKSWIDPKGCKNKLAADSSRLNNFTTKYLIYETLNELTITADKSKFGKNTLQMVKESAMIFGLAVVVNEYFFGDYASFETRTKRQPNQSVIDEELLEDTISFNQTIDMVLNVCITNPNLKGYFPLYGRLENQEDPNRFWYENDSRYLNDQDSLHKQYQSIYKEVDSLFGYINDIKTIKDRLIVLKEVEMDSLFSISNQLCENIKKGDTLNTEAVMRLKACLKEIDSLLPMKELNLIPAVAKIHLKIDSVVTKFSTDGVRQLNEIILLINGVNETYNEIKKGDFHFKINSFAPQFSEYIAKKDGAYKQRLLADSKYILTTSLDKKFKERLTHLMDAKDLVFDVKFMTEFNQLNADYKNWKLDQSFGGFDQGKVDAFFKALDKEGNTLHAPKQPFKAFKKNLNNQLASGKSLTKGDILAALVDLKKNEKWRDVLDLKRFSSYKNDNISMLDSLMLNLEKVSNRISFVNKVLQTLSSTEKTFSNKRFTFNEQQIDLTKELMGSFIDYLSKSGRFSVASVYLRSIVDNVSYNEADSIDHKPATISLSFESVLYSLKDQLVKPSQLYRTRYVQPFINIGVNYSGFLFTNQLNIAANGDTSTLKGMTFASEKIGVKFKIINREYTRSFKPGIVYKYYGHNWSWDRPQPQGLIDDLFLDIHTGGLLYNVVNLKTQDNFNFPYVGCGIGVRTFNGLTFSGSFNMPYTGDSFRSKNAFVTFSLDIPIIEYITAIRSK